MLAALAERDRCVMQYFSVKNGSREIFFTIETHDTSRSLTLQIFDM